MKRNFNGTFVGVLALGALAIGLFVYMETANRFFSNRFAQTEVETGALLSESETNSASENAAPSRLEIGRLPLSFEANQGQAAGDFDFISRNVGNALYLSSTKAVIALPRTSGEKREKKNNLKTELLQIQLANANSKAEAKGIEKLAAESNYLNGNDSSKWRQSVPHFAKVQFSEVYSGVDVVYYGNQRQLEYDFVVKPGGDPNSIQLKFDGARSVRIDEAGNLIAQTASGEVKQQAPIIYQEIDGTRRAIDGEFVARSQNEIGFRIGEYDRNQRLVIDPILVYSTYIGGSDGGLFNIEAASKIFLDSARNVYIAGITPSGDFPTRNPYQASSGGGADCFISKLNQNGTDLIFSTYLGGNDGDNCSALFIDANNNIYVGGQTFSTNFPLLNPYQSTNAGNGDAFITKLNPAGNALIFSTFLGGSFSEQVADIRTDASGNVYFGGATGSDNFPVVNAIQPNYAGNQDCFFAKLNPTGNALLYSTYFGGVATDAGFGFALDAQGNSFLTGVTNSRDYPVTAGVFQSVKSGSDDAFVTKLNANGNLVYSTFIGGNGIDSAGDIAVDAQGNAVITGFTRSLNFPRRNAFQAQRQGDVDSFVTKFAADGKSLIFSTFLGGSELERGFGVALDADNNIYTTGRTNSGDFPLKKAIQDFAGLDDIYVVKFTSEGGLVFSTPLGGDTNDVGNDVAADNNANVYVAGGAEAGLRTTPGAFQTASAGGLDAFVAKINTATRVVRSDFDGDRISDIAVFRPSNGFWYILNSSTNSFQAVQFGANGDRPVPGDYDGDGRTDIAVFRPANSTWYVLRSQDNRFLAVSWGSQGDKPVQGDYDADSITDIAVFRPSIGFWLILKSTDNTLRSQQFGAAEDKPVPGDYDGDEQTDLAYFKPGNGVWSILQSFAGFKSQQFGLSTDVLTAADYDGDGKDDIAVFRPAGGYWFVTRSRDNSFVGEQFGSAGDIPVPGDYDGDRKADLAVYRNGFWYIRTSSNNGFRAVQFGTSEDIPIPSTYQP